MWASHDNGYDISWYEAVEYCKNYKGGGYTDWRIPNQTQLLWLFNDGKFFKKYYITNHIKITSGVQWASESDNSLAAIYDYYAFRSIRMEFRPKLEKKYRVIPVRPVRSANKSGRNNIEPEKCIEYTQKFY
jgi:hypothetical protein